MSTVLLSESKQTKNSKYITADIDSIPEYYLFDIQLESKKKFKNIKKISTDNTKYLLNNYDKIIYKKYKNINFKIINIKKQIISHDLTINLSKDYIIHKDKSIYLEISNKNGYLTLFYNLESNFYN